MAKTEFSISLKLLTQQFKGGISKVQNQLNNFKKTLVGAFAGLGAIEFGRQLVRAGADFQSAMSRVQAVSKSSTNELKAMREEAMRLGRDTKYTATEAANALEQLVRNGLKPLAAKDALGGTLQLAQSQAISLAEAADIATTAMNAFNLKTSEMARINDVLASTASATATNVLELFEAFKVAGPVAYAAGVSLEETATVLGSLANRGFRGSEAGTGLKQIVLALASQTPEATKVLQKYGVQVDETSLKTKGLISSLKDLGNAGLGNSIADMGDFFNKLGAPKGAALLGNTAAMEDLYQIVTNSQGEAARMFEEGLGAWEKAYKTLISVYENTQIKVFDGLESVFTEPLNVLAEILRRIQDIPTMAMASFGLLAGGLGKIFRNVNNDLTKVAEKQYTALLKKKQSATNNAGIAHSVVNASSSIPTDNTKAYYSQLQTELSKVGSQYNLNSKNGIALKKVMTDLNVLTSDAEPTTKKYRRASADLTTQMDKLKNVAAHTKLNVLQTDLKRFENDKKGIISGVANLQTTTIQAFSKIGTAAKTLGTGIVSFFGGWIGLAITAASIIGTYLVSAWRKSTEAVRESNKLMDEAKQKNIELDTTFTQLINILRTHEQSTYEWQAAMNKLKREYPDLLEKLHLEQVSVNQSAAEYAKLAGRIKDVIAWQKNYNLFTAKQEAVDTLKKGFFSDNGVYKDWLNNFKKLFKSQFGDVEEVAEIKKGGVDAQMQGILTDGTSDSSKKAQLIKLYTDAFKDGKYTNGLKQNAEYFANRIMEVFNKKAGNTIKELNKAFDTKEPVIPTLSSDIDKMISDSVNSYNLQREGTYTKADAMKWDTDKVNQELASSADKFLTDLTDKLQGMTFENAKGDKVNALDYAKSQKDYLSLLQQSKLNISTKDKKDTAAETVKDAEKKYAIQLDYISKEKELDYIDEKKFNEKKLNAIQTLTSSYEFNSDATKIDTKKYKELIDTRDSLIDTLKKQEDEAEAAKENKRFDNTSSDNAARLKKNYDNTMKGAGREKINKWDYLSFNSKEDKSSEVDLGYLKTQLDKLKQIRSSIGEDEINKAKELSSVGTLALLKEVDTLDSAIEKLGEHVIDLEDKFQLKQAQENLRLMRKEIGERQYDAIKSTYSATKELVDVFSQFSDFGELSVGEQFTTIIDTVFSTIDAITSLIDTWTQLSELLDSFGTATQTLAAIEQGITDQKIINTQTEAAAVVAGETTKSVAKVEGAATSIAADTTEAAVTKTTAVSNIAANTAEGASEAGASAAGLPFPWNIVAIGGAIAAAIAAFALIPKFANGGIIGGSKYSGDQNLARVNSGEMILNGSQQKNLWNAISGNKLSVGSAGGDVTFTIAGDKLKGVLKNHDSKMNKIK